MEFSSNWRTLQKKLQGDKQISPNKPTKRKRPNGGPNFPRKRRSMATTQSTPSNKHEMGGPASKQQSNNLVSNGSIENLQHDAQDFLSSSLQSHNSQNSTSAASISSAAAKKYVALDCEMVGVGSTPDADSVLARVSVVNYHGTILYDTYVLPPDGVKVTDYRTAISGIRPEHLKPNRNRSDVATLNPTRRSNLPTDSQIRQGEAIKAESLVNLRNQPLASLYSAQSSLDTLLKGRILIGHALKNDFSALLLSHPHALIRDTSRYAPFRALAGGRTPSLRKLAKQILGREIQTGEHSSVEDARAAMDLFKHVRGEWEGGIRAWKGNGKKGPQKGKIVNWKAIEREQGGEERDEVEDDEGEEELEEDGTVRARKERRKTRLKKKKTRKRTKRA
ncbi:MAG: hypothetical protein Q9165_005474 [Trypethelium subeluteriae]